MRFVSRNLVKSLILSSDISYISFARFSVQFLTYLLCMKSITNFLSVSIIQLLQQMHGDICSYVSLIHNHFVLGQVITGSWDKTLKCWDPRSSSGQDRSLVGTYTQPERVYSMSLVGNRLVVATAGRHVNVYDLRNMSQPEQRRESSLKYQTRCVRCYPNGTGAAFSNYSL